MSKNVPASFKPKSPEKFKNSMPVLRDVSPPSVIAEQCPVIVVYKDMNPPPQSKNNQSLWIAFGIFMVLGLGILLGSHLAKPRGVASAMGAGLVAVGQPSVQEHYHYDKTCYTGDSGEQICDTHTSRK